MSCCITPQMCSLLWPMPVVPSLWPSRGKAFWSRGSSNTVSLGGPRAVQSILHDSFGEPVVGQVYRPRTDLSRPFSGALFQDLGVSLWSTGVQNCVSALAQPESLGDTSAERSSDVSIPGLPGLWMVPLLHGLLRQLFSFSTSLWRTMSGAVFCTAA